MDDIDPEVRQPFPRVNGVPGQDVVDGLPADRADLALGEALLKRRPVAQDPGGRWGQSLMLYLGSVYCSAHGPSPTSSVPWRALSHHCQR